MDQGEFIGYVVSEMIHHTRMREMIHLMNYFLQHIELGTEDLAYLSHLSEEAWKIKKETVKRLAEEASAKMVLPMMLIFMMFHSWEGMVDGVGMPQSRW